MCEYCGKPNEKCQVIGVHKEDYVAFIPTSMLCPMCDGTAFVRLQGWKNRKPCPVCKGVGQLREKELPTKHQMVDMVLEITPVQDREKVLNALA